MRAIIIEEERFTELCDLLKAEAERISRDSSTPERLNLDRNIWRTAVEEAYRMMNYQVVRWSQSHGASCTMRGGR